MTAGGETFVSVPRWIVKTAQQPHVPATLCKLVPNPYSSDPHSALLQPYPSWAMNKVGDPTALQSVQGIEIDPSTNYLWALDQGLQIDPLTDPPTPGYIKLVIINLANDQVVRTHNFDGAIAPVTSLFNDLAIDVVRKVAYITDSGIHVPADPNQLAHGALIVYDYGTDSARRFLSGAPSTSDDHSVTVMVNGQRALLANRLRTGADGIALSADLATLYFCPLTSRSMFSVPTSVLRDPSSTANDVSNKVVNLGTKPSASGGITIDSNGVLYLTMLEDNAVGVFDRQKHTVRTLVSDANLLVWPDTFGFDHHGSIIFTTNRLNSFLDRKLVFDNSTMYNFHIWSLYLGQGIGAYTDNPPDLSGSSKNHGLKLAFPIAMAVIICIGIIGLLAYVLHQHRRRLAGDLEYMTEGYAEAPSLNGYGGAGATPYARVIDESDSTEKESDMMIATHNDDHRDASGNLSRTSTSSRSGYFDGQSGQINNSGPGPGYQPPDNGNGNGNANL
jgi:sugar lactone lactonase YvrE